MRAADGSMLGRVPRRQEVARRIPPPVPHGAQREHVVTVRDMRPLEDGGRPPCENGCRSTPPS